MAQSLVDRILPELEEIILKPPFRTDRPFSERSLCERLEVSRSVLREALRSLRQRGLVEILPGKGIFPARNIDTPTIQYMQDYLRRKEIGFRELLEGRLFLETHIAVLAAERRDESNLIKLADAQMRMEDSQNEASAFEAADLDFHHELAAATGNELYLIWLQPIVGMLQGRRDRVITLGEVRVRTLESHRKILEAVKSGDRDAAGQEMERHLHDFEVNTRLAVKLGLLPPEDEEQSVTA